MYDHLIFRHENIGTVAISVKREIAQHFDESFDGLVKEIVKEKEKVYIKSAIVGFIRFVKI